MSDTCKKCGVHDPEDKLDSVYVTRPLGEMYSHDRWCGPCAVAVWPCNVHFVWHLDVPDEVRRHFLTIDMLKRLRQWDVPHRYLPVHFFHRRETESTRWMMEWDHRSQYSRPAEPYGYRAWCSYDSIVMLVDETETLASLEWVFYHELGHAICSRAKMFDQAMEREDRNEGRKGYEFRDDVAHESYAEERLVNRMATAWTGGQERARPWWRPRVTALQRGYTVLPDAFAPLNSPEFLVFAMAKAEGWASPLKIHGFDESLVECQLEELKQRVSTYPTEEMRKDPAFRREIEENWFPASVETERTVYDVVRPIPGPITGTMTLSE